MSHPRDSVAVTLSRVSGDRTVHGLSTNVKLSLISPHNTRYDHVYAPAGTVYSQKMISWAPDGLFSAVNSIQL